MAFNIYNILSEKSENAELGERRFSYYPCRLRTVPCFTCHRALENSQQNTERRRVSLYTQCDVVKEKKRAAHVHKCVEERGV